MPGLWTRSLIATTWRGRRMIRALQAPADQWATVAALQDWQVEHSLLRLDGWGWLAGGVPVDPGDRRQRLSTWPSPEDCEAIAELMVPYFDGVKPVVRIVEQAYHRPVAA